MLRRACFAATGSAARLQRRWSTGPDMDEIQQRMQKKARERHGLMNEMKQLVSYETQRAEANVITGENIKKEFTEFLITHVGSMDGEDVELPQPLRMTRREALAYAERDGHALCFIERGPDGEAVCRLRYLKMWVRQQAHDASLVSKKEIERKLRDNDRGTPSTEEVHVIKSAIDHQGCRAKLNAAFETLKHGRNARLNLKYFSSEEDAEIFLTDLLSMAQTMVTDHGFTFQVKEKSVHKKGGSCLLVAVKQ
ncbi:hypothetical protein DIPPA_09998 [Diplonema papillatum]|nr:hypothetical protein DIPPA_09998 [Diplonema papillatum]